MSRTRGERATPVLALLSACFLAGGVLGCLSGSTEIAAGITRTFLSESIDGIVEPPTVMRETWALLRWPIAGLVLGRLPYSGRSLPVLFLLRGYLLSFGISTFAAGNGAAGWAGSILLFGPTCLLTLPVFFLIGVDQLMARGTAEHTGAWAPTVKTGIPPLLLCGLLDCKVIPVLLGAVLGRFTGA